VNQREPRSTTDLIVLIFVLTVAFILVVFAMFLALSALFTDDNNSDGFAILSHVLTTLISAMLGFVAGRRMVNGRNGR
jgi:hypothetical protein